MPTLIKLTFPAGRYHATPWGRHVNEGVAEWPPNPWRLLRALVAVWKRTCADVAEDQIKRILESLIRPPRFRLPPHRVAHTRHYMPWEKKGPADRALIFDTFISVSRDDALYVGWPDAELSSDDRRTLSRLLGNLSWLGRAESWTCAELSDDTVELDVGEADKAEPNPILVFCANPETAFSDEHYPKHDLKKLAIGKINPGSFLFDCPRWQLCLDTETIHAKRWPTVPGAQWISYSRPDEHQLIRKGQSLPIRPKPTAATFLLDGPVLPLVKNTVQIAEKFRDAAMSMFGRCCQGRDEAAEYLRSDARRHASPTFSGKDRNGNRRTSHGHAHFLPMPDKIDPRYVREVLVYAPAGFQPLEVTALKQLRDVQFDQLSCRAQLIGLGGISSLKPPVSGSSTTWISVTPFVAHRHARIRGRNRDVPQNPDDPRGSFLAVVAREICQLRGLPLIEAAPMKAAKGQLQFYEFRRARRKAGNDAYTRTAGYLRLTFSEPVDGPLCLGYNSHFGMGLFTAEDLS